VFITVIVAASAWGAVAKALPKINSAHIMRMILEREGVFMGITIGLIQQKVMRGSKHGMAPTSASCSKRSWYSPNVAHLMGVLDM
jgi:hypothetical protein